VLLFRAAAAIMQPFGLQEEDIKTQVIANAMDVTFFTPAYLKG
jgi:hypothetical protein